MKRSMKAPFSIGLALTILIVFSCGGSTGQEAVPDGRAGAGATDASSATPSASFSASCVYVEGFVERGRGDGWAPLEIGDSVEAQDTIRSGPDGSCEIVFGGTATLRVQPGTVLSLQSLALSEESSRIEAKLATGSILNKVHKLAGTDSYMINTDTTVCGVRGTDFFVSVDPEKGTTVAVKEGRVAVVPSSPVVFQLLEASAESEAAAQAIESIVASASLVEPDQEITVSKAMAESASEAYGEIAAIVAAAPPSESAGRKRIAPPAMIMFDRDIGYGRAVALAQAQDAAAGGSATAAAAPAIAPAAAEPAPAEAAEAVRPELADTVKRLRAAAVRIKPALPAPVRAAPATKERMKALDSMQAPAAPAMEPVSMVPTPEASPSPASSVPGPATETVPPAPAKPAPAKPAPAKPEPAKPTPPQAAQVTAPVASAKPDPVLGSWKALSGPVAGSVVRVGTNGVFVLSDPDGNLTGMSADGKVLWQLKTANRGADRSYPVPFKGLVYYTGSNELVAVDAATGAVVAREALEGDRAHIFGTRVVPFPGAVVSPTRDTLEVLDERTGKVMRSIPVPDGITMTPANYDGLAAIVNQKGVFMLLDLATGQIKAQVQTGAVQPVALAPRIHGTLACFADRKGLLVMVDLKSMKVAWERSLPGAAGVFSDIEIGDEGVFAFSKDMIYSYNLRGERLMEPIAKVSAPPLLSKGILYYGTLDGFLVAVRVKGGVELGRVDLGGKATARPLFSEGAIYVGTAGGKLVKVGSGSF